MTKKTIGIWIVLAILLSCFPFDLAQPALASGNTEAVVGTVQHVNRLQDLKRSLADPSWEGTLVLDDDLEWEFHRDQDSSDRFIHVFNVDGNKRLDLNGHTISFSAGGPSSPDFQILQHPRDIYKPEGGASPDYEAMFGTAGEEIFGHDMKSIGFTIRKDASLFICDSSSKQTGGIRIGAYIASIKNSVIFETLDYTHQHLEEERQNLVQNIAPYISDLFYVESGGYLGIAGGTMTAGRSKEQWMTNASRIATQYNGYDNHTGNGKRQVVGSTVTVENGATFESYGGTYNARGYDRIWLWYGKALYAAGYEYSFKFKECKLDTPCAAVRALEGSTVRIYDGNFIGNAGADCIQANGNADVSVYSGSFKTTEQSYFLLGSTGYRIYYTDHPATSRQAYLKVPYGKIGVTKEMFAYGDDALAIYKSTTADESMRVVLSKEASRTDTQEPSASATITITNGKEKIVVQDDSIPVYDGKGNKLLIKPKSETMTLFTNIQNEVSNTPAKIECAQNADLILTAAGTDTFFPDDSFDPLARLALYHSWDEITWEVDKKNDQGKWITYIANLPGTSDGGRKLNLKEAFSGAKVGDTYRVRAVYAERYIGAHDYTIRTISVTPDIVIVPHDRLCTHDYVLVNDTATCKAPGVKRYACRKCGDEYEEHSPMTYTHDYRLKMNSDYCWEECAVCGVIQDKQKHTFDDGAHETLDATSERVVYTCRRCRWTRAENVKSECKHEFSPNCVLWDEDYHYAQCLKCGNVYRYKHDLYSEYNNYDEEFIRCRGTKLDSGADIWCMYLYETATGDNIGLAHVASSYNVVDGESVRLPATCCIHDTLTLDFSHLSPGLQAASKHITWCLIGVSKAGTNDSVYIDGKTSIRISDYLAGTTGRLEGVTCYVAVDDLGGKQFVAETHVMQRTHIDGYAPTCGSPGQKEHWVCACGKTLDSEEDHANEIDAVIPPTGAHTYQNDCDAACETCGAVREAPHRWSDHLIGLGMNADGQITHGYKCTACGAEKDIAPCDFERFVDKSSCTEEGRVYYVCKVCGRRIDTDIISKTEHDYKVEEYVPATCVSEGHASYKCTVCGDAHSDTLPLIDHILVKAEATHSTCMEHGTAEHYVCAMCGKCFADEEGNVPVTAKELELPLDPKRHVKTSGFDYSYNETDHWYACDCGTVLLSERHSFDEHDTCTACGYIKDQDLILTEEEISLGATIHIMPTPDVGSVVAADTDILAFWNDTESSDDPNGNTDTTHPGGNDDPDHPGTDSGNSILKKPIFWIGTGFALLLVGVIVLLILLLIKQSKKEKKDEEEE